MVEWLTAERFDSGLSLLSLLVTLAGLGGGGYAAGRVTGVTRMRVEDRRVLLDDLTPRLHALEPSGWDELEPTPARELRSLMRQIDTRTRFLALPDRWAWQAVRDLLPIDVLDERSPSAGTIAVFGNRGKVPQEEWFRMIRAQDPNEDPVRVAWRLLKGRICLFERHLEANLRTGLRARILRLSTALAIVRQRWL